jgi:hypothetical protein
MDPSHTIHHLAHILAGLAGTAVAHAIAAYTAMPAALAATSPRPAGPAPASSRPANWPPLPPGWNKHPPLPARTQTPPTGGLPGWEITLITAAAALLIIALAVIACRMHATRRRVTASA